MNRSAIGKGIEHLSALSRGGWYDSSRDILIWVGSPTVDGSLAVQQYWSVVLSWLQLPVWSLYLVANVIDTDI